MFLSPCLPVTPIYSISPCEVSSHRSHATAWLRKALLLLCVFAAVVQSAPSQTATSVNVPTWRYDNTHAGANTQETLLTTANVTPSSFGLLFSRSVDGYVYAQPLYISSLTMSDGLMHNVLFVATEHDSVYAFDADSNAGANAHPLWQISLLSPSYGAAAGATTVPSADVDSTNIAPEIGITSTPVINVAGNTMYVVAKTKESGAYVQRLHAINILTGAEQPNSPKIIQATVSGTGIGSSGGQLAFDPLRQLNRPALAYYNGVVYAAFGSHGDEGSFHGWLFAFDGTTLTQTSVLCLSPTGSDAGIWASGAGLPIDSGGTAGRMFLVTGNGTNSAYPPFNPGVNLGDSIVTVSLANGGLVVTDAFTSFNQATLSGLDHDQGSGGILMLPDQTGPNPHVLIQAGKEGRILVLNRDNLGGYLPGGTSNTNALQDITGEITGLWSTPAYWNGNVYIWGNGDYAKAFSLNNGVLTPAYTSISGVSTGYPGASFVVSSNGTANGIAWAVKTGGASEILYAFDATNLSTILYESDKQARDNAGPTNKFVVPVVTNGHVYVAAAYQVDVFGLLNGESVAATPTFSPKAGAFELPQPLSLSTTTLPANIYYTLDQTVPTTGSTIYTSPITLIAPTTIKAIASATNYLQSAIASATFTIPTQTPAPSFIPASGTYTSSQQVVIADADRLATIYYTLDGSAPTTTSTVYTAPITVAANTTINAAAIDSTRKNNNLATAPYVIQAGGSSMNFGSGFASVNGLTFNGSAVAASDGSLELTNGGTYEAGSAFSSQPINVQAFTTDFAFQQLNAIADGFTFTIQNAGATALGSNAGALGYGNSKGTGIPTSVAVKFDIYNNAGEGNDSTGFYTDGALPQIPATDMTSSGVILRSGDTMQAHLNYDGTTLSMRLTDSLTGKTFTYGNAINIPQIVGGATAYIGFTGGTGGSTSTQKILTWTYASQPGTSPTATPSFSPVAGNYTTGQSVVVSDASSGAVIYYTTDGSLPTTSSAVYHGAIGVSTGTTTIKAIAVAPSTAQSAVGQATYVISSVTAAPVFSPGAGTYPSATQISISDSTSGAVIYYTGDGTTPTTASTVYSSPIVVGTGTTTLKALAVAAVASQSTVSSATYSVSAPATTTPVFSPAPGSYSTAQSVAISDSSSGSTIYYTTDGSSPTTSSSVYSSPIQVESTEVIHAMAIAPGLSASVISAGGYTIQATPVAIHFPSGFAGAGSSLALNGAGILNGSMLQIAKAGATYTQSAIWFATPVSIATFTTDFDFQILSGVADGFTFAIQNQGLSAMGPSGGGLGYGAAKPGGAVGIGESLAIKFDIYNNNGEGTDSTGFYTNGSSPTIPATNLSPSIVLKSGHTLHAHITYDGTTLTLALTDPSTSESFTTTYNVNLSTVVGGPTAYVGFTAGTGGSTMTANILDWIYQN
ncbi:chitobiase/beta-hexosaminidase C-terminal domain-containing protein [Tunturiibacter psychrotolerans]|uniref:chitobiase/beta-hexosaminidase C-terminal domain-containing protein n=1 Tax=Tunturiibacter psychrotolerans TaxID=3069686 RepID=UPI003D252051